ncbi:hypothetical protein TNCV_2446471 [Trichonephila clavipes]|nr:hypothetical protein TNCV_2446471 [Trichonephila clavipes]
MAVTGHDCLQSAASSSSIRCYILPIGCSPKSPSHFSTLSIYLRGIELLNCNKNNDTATAGSDVVQSGRPTFDDFFQHFGRISAITRRMLSSQRVKRLGYPHRPMTLHSPQKIV